MCEAVKKGRWANARRFKPGDRVSVVSTYFDPVEGGELCYSSTLKKDETKLYGKVTDVFTATARVKWTKDGFKSTVLFKDLTLESDSEEIPEESSKCSQKV